MVPSEGSHKLIIDSIPNKMPQQVSSDPDSKPTPIYKQASILSLEIPTDDVADREDEGNQEESPSNMQHTKSNLKMVQQKMFNKPSLKWQNSK